MCLIKSFCFSNTTLIVNSPHVYVLGSHWREQPKEELTGNFDYIDCVLRFERFFIHTLLATELISL